RNGGKPSVPGSAGDTPPDFSGRQPPFFGHRLAGATLGRVKETSVRSAPPVDASARSSCAWAEEMTARAGPRFPEVLRGRTAWRGCLVLPERLSPVTAQAIRQGGPGGRCW